ncbi:hypothetical protein BGZ76_005053, partial [Entomortierella beljakovae]
MIDEKKELGKTAAGEEVNQEVAKEIQKLKAQLHDLAEENQRKSDLQNSVLRAEMEKERKIYQEKLEKLEYDRIVLMEEHKRTEEANSTLMQEFRREQKERDRQREELAQSLENAKLATNEIDRRNARLEAVIKNHNDNIWLKRERKRKGWWYKTRNALGLAKNAHTPQDLQVSLILTSVFAGSTVYKQTENPYYIAGPLLMATIVPCTLAQKTDSLSL